MVDQAPQLPNLRNPDLPGLPVLALDDHPLAGLLDDQVHATVGARTTTRSHDVSGPPVVLAQVALELKRVELAQVGGAVEAAAIKGTANDTGQGGEDDGERQQPQEDLSEHDDQRTQRAVHWQVRQYEADAYDHRSRHHARPPGKVLEVLGKLDDQGVVLPAR